MDVASVRVDSWLWAVRVFRSRSLATAACRAGHVQVNGDRVKAAQPLRPGDEVRIRISGFDRILVVQQIIAKRASPVIAAASYRDDTPPPPTPVERFLAPRRDRGAGRPTKRERRDIERFRGRVQE